VQKSFNHRSTIV